MDKDITFNIYENDIQIIDSYKVPKNEFNEILDYIKGLYPEHIVFKERKRIGLIFEWAVHNLMYILDIKKESAKDVDLDYPQKWYTSLGYYVFGPISWILIK